MTRYLLAFSAGAILLYCGSPLLAPSAALFNFSGMASAFLFVFYAVSRQRTLSVYYIWQIILCVSLLMMGFGYASKYAEKRIDSVIPERSVGERLMFEGRLCDLPLMRHAYQQYTFCNLQQLNDDLGNDALLIEKAKLSATTAIDVTNNGQCWRLALTLKQPRATYNPWMSSYEQYLFYHGIAALGSIKSAEPTVCIADSPKTWLFSLRLAVSNHLDVVLADMPHSGLIRALVLGDRNKISTHEHQVLQRSGTQHLMAISGLHVGLIMWFLFALLGTFLKGRSRVLCSALGGIIYIALVGFSPSAQRAWVMALIIMLYQQGYFAPRLFKPFIVALAFVLILDPLATLNAGFWFSFCAVAFLLWLIKLKAVSSNVWSLLKVQCFITAWMYFLLAGFSQETSVWSILGNIVAIPWISLVVLPLAMFGFLLSYYFDTSFVFIFLGEVLSFLLTYLDSLAEQAVYLPSPSVGIVSLLCGFVFLIALLLRRITVYSSALGLSFVALVSFVNQPNSDALSRLVVLDAGQGLSVIAKSNAHAWVYDVGPKYERFVFSERVLWPLLRSSKHRTINLVLSHGDNDHAGGANELLEKIGPQNLWLGEPERLSNNQFFGRQCVEGMRWAREKFTVEVLFPSTAYLAKDVQNANARSCVIKLNIATTSMLLMGDIEGQAERDFLTHFSERGRLSALEADILIAGHHGAKAATSMTLLKWVKPKHVVLSAGYANRFNHPHDGVMGRIERIGAQALLTAETGALLWETTGGDGEPDFQLVQSRKQNLPFWIMP